MKTRTRSRTGQEMKALREGLGIIQQEWGEMLGLSRPTVYRLEQRKKMPYEGLMDLALRRLEKYPHNDRRTMTGNQLRSYRVALNMTQAKLAETFGTHPLTIQRWEQEGDKPIRSYGGAMRLAMEQLGVRTPPPATDRVKMYPHGKLKRVKKRNRLVGLKTED